MIFDVVFTLFTKISVLVQYTVPLLEADATKVDDASAALEEPIPTVLPSILIPGSLSILVFDVSIVASSFSSAGGNSGPKTVEFSRVGTLVPSITPFILIEYLKAVREGPSDVCY